MSIEWDGKGLPPVGCECEVKSEDFCDWIKIKVVYAHNGEIAAIVSALNSHFNDRLEKFSAGYNGAQFRPIRTKAEINRSDSVDAFCDVLVVSRDCGARESLYKIYDAIAAGKIPGIRLTDDAGS